MNSRDLLYNIVPAVNKNILHIGKFIMENLLRDRLYAKCSYHSRVLWEKGRLAVAMDVYISINYFKEKSWHASIFCLNNHILHIKNWILPLFCVSLCLISHFSSSPFLIPSKLAYGCPRIREIIIENLREIITENHNNNWKLMSSFHKKKQYKLIFHTCHQSSQPSRHPSIHLLVYLKS